MLKLVLVSMVTIGGSMFGFKLSARAPATTNAALVPIVVESTGHGERSWDLFSRMMKDGVIFLTSTITDDVANSIVAQLLFLAEEKKVEEITIYINSPGGSISAGMAIYDTMQYVMQYHNKDVCTFGLGRCASMAAFLLTSGAEGKRYSLPNTTVMIHQPLSQGIHGQATDIKIQAEEIDRQKEVVIEILSQHTGKSPEQIREDIDRDNYMTAEEAKEYGIVDEILNQRPLDSDQ